jgi:hypothetical protein
MKICSSKAQWLVSRRWNSANKDTRALSYKVKFLGDTSLLDWLWNDCFRSSLERFFFRELA